MPALHFVELSLCFRVNSVEMISFRKTTKGASTAYLFYVLNSLAVANLLPVLVSDMKH